MEEMHVNDKSRIFILFLTCLILLSSCATLTRHPIANKLQAYTAKDNKSIFNGDCDEKKSLLLTGYTKS
jgi:hypothetical protein